MEGEARTVFGEMSSKFDDICPKFDDICPNFGDISPKTPRKAPCRRRYIGGSAPKHPALAGSPCLGAPFGRKPLASANGITYSESVMWSLICCGSGDQIFLKTASFLKI